MGTIEWDYTPLVERAQRLSNDTSELETHLESVRSVGHATTYNPLLRNRAIASHLISFS